MQIQVGFDLRLAVSIHVYEEASDIVLDTQQQELAWRPHG